MPATHVIGLLLGAEEDWPAAFESLLERVAPSITQSGLTHEFTTERVTIEPFNLRAVPRYSLVIDRLAWWYHMPREWLKKVALMNEVHLLNNPFTFQSMEKHAAYCAMMRLGLRVPETWMVPNKVPPDNPRFATTAERYVRRFDLEGVADATPVGLARPAPTTVPSTGPICTANAISVHRTPSGAEPIPGPRRINAGTIGAVRLAQAAQAAGAGANPVIPNSVLEMFLGERHWDFGTRAPATLEKYLPEVLTI